MVDPQLPVDTPAHRPWPNDAAMPAQGRQEHQGGDICPAGQSRVLLSPTEEYRLRAATFLEQPQQGPESDGIAMEMQLHSKVTAIFFGLIILLLHYKLSFKCIMLRRNCGNANTHF